MRRRRVLGGALGAIIAVNVSSCVAAGPLDAGSFTACSVWEPDRALILGVTVTNTSASPLALASARVVDTHDISIDEVSVARTDAGALGWGLVDRDDLPSELEASYAERESPDGALVEPGETAWVLITFSSDGEKADEAWARGIEVAYMRGGAPGTTTADVGFGFVSRADFDAGTSECGAERGTEG